MRLLVTGAGGLVGRHLLAEAAARGFAVHAVARPGGALRPAAPGVVWSEADLSAPEAAAALVRAARPTHLIHAAWDTRHPVYWNSPDNLSWLAATAAMARAFAEVGGERFVLVGSCAEYDWTHGYMVEGVTPERPSTLYGVCKLAAHQAVQGAMRLGFSAATARLFFTFGPHEQPSRFVPYLCRTLRDGGRARLSGGRQLRDLLTAEDTARALLAVAEAADLTGAVNIGSGEPVTLGAVARRLGEVAGRPDCVGIGDLPERPDDPTVLLPSVARLFSTGWRPSADLDRGLAETYAWWAAAPQAGEGERA